MLTTLGLLPFVLTPAPAQAQTAPTVTLSVTPSATMPAGEFFTIAADVTLAPDVDGQTPTVTTDPIGVAVNKFVQPLTPNPTSCLTGHGCFWHFMQSDVFATPGPHPISVTVTDAKGRSTTASTNIILMAPTDDDRDGLPDVWETFYGLSSFSAAGNDGPDGDPDGDGVTNLDEYRAHTNPIARFQRVFAEGSYGDRQSLTTCFDISPWDSNVTFPSPVTLTAIGDSGRTYRERIAGYQLWQSCPLGNSQPFVADRIVAVIVESLKEVAVERTMQTVSGDGTSLDRFTLLNESLGVQSPSRNWYFARGAAGRGLDLFFLAFNPGTDPVDATFTFSGGAGDPRVQLTRTLSPGTRTTIWINQDVPAAAAYDAATTVTASNGIYVERAWRYQSPGRTAPHDSVSRGAAAPSPTWYFAVGDLSASFETSFAVMNPNDARISVDAKFLRPDGDPVSRTLDLLPHSRQIVRPRDLGVGAASVGLVLTAANGAGIVAKRTVDGVAPTGAWRQSTLGATTVGTSVTFAISNPEFFDAEEPVCYIANTSNVAGRARIGFHTNDDDHTVYTDEIDLPAQRVVRRPVLNKGLTSWVTIDSLSTAGGAAPAIVVERATSVTVDGASGARQVTIVGNVVH